MENDVFEFGNKPNEDTENFNYENISGLGESNYENEDLFDTMPSIPSNNTTSTIEPMPNNLDINNFDYNLASDNSFPTIEPMPVVEEPKATIEPLDAPVEEPKPTIEPMSVVEEVKPTIEPLEAPKFSDIFDVGVEQTNNVEPVQAVENNPVEEVSIIPEIPTVETPVEEIPAMGTVTTEEQPIEEVTEQEPVQSTEEVPVQEVTPTNSDIFYTGDDDKNEEITVAPLEASITEDYKPIEEPKVETNNMYSSFDSTPDIPMSKTPIDELEKLTEYEEEKIDTTDINSLFEKLSVNVKDASDIFSKNFFFILINFFHLFLTRIS